MIFGGEVCRDVMSKVVQVCELAIVKETSTPITRGKGKKMKSGGGDLFDHD